jgi:Fic family protein
MTTYIWQYPDWPNWRYDMTRLAVPLAMVRHDQGRLLGRMETLGFTLRDEAWLQTLTQDVVKTSEIEGEHLDNEQVRCFKFHMQTYSFECRSPLIGKSTCNWNPG